MGRPCLFLQGLVAVVLAVFAGSAEVRATDAYFASRIWTGDRLQIEDGVLVVRDGKILAVGVRGAVVLPAGTNSHELGDVTLIPGLVIAETGLAEGSRGDDRAMTPEVRAIDGFDPFADRGRILAGGVTTIGIVPGANRLIPGQGAVVKLAGEDIAGRTLVESESLRILLSRASRNPPTIFDPPVGAVSVERPLRSASPQLAATLGGAVSGIRAVLRAAQDPGALAGDGREKSAANVLLGPVADYMAHRRTIRITASEPAEIRAALMLAREFELKILLVDGVGLEPLLDQIERWSPVVRGVVLNAGYRPGSISNPPVPQDESPPPRLPWENARDLLRAGVKVAIRAAHDDDLPEMLFVGGLFTRGEISSAEVLRMLTLTPAELLGVADRVGSLAVGKDADFAVLSGDPFATRAQVLATYVNGRSVSQPAAAATATVISAAAVYTGTGEIVDRGSIVVQGSIVRGLGRDVSAPSDAAFRRYRNAVIVPGFIDLSTGLGLGGPLSGNLPLQTKLGEQLFSGDPAVAIARQGGVTTVLLGSTGPAPSPLVAFKLGNQLRVLKDPVALRFTVAGNLSSQVPALRRTLAQAKSYAESWSKYEAQLPDYERQLKEYEAAKAKYDAAQKEAEAKKAADTKPGSPAQSTPDGKQAAPGGQSDSKGAPADKPTESKPTESKPAESKPAESKAPTMPTAPTKPTANAALDPFRALFAGKIPAMVEARQANAVAEAVKLFRDEFQLPTILIGADDAARTPELVAKKQIAVAAGPSLIQTIDRQRVNLPQILANHQVPFGFQSQATTGVQMLPLVVQHSVSQGLSRDDALLGLTAAPAKFLSLDSQVGTLAVGKDADLVVLSGPPFEPSTQVLAVMIDGQWVYEREELR